MFSCSENSKSLGSKNNAELTKIELKYAKGFTVEFDDKNIFVTIINPNNGKVVQEIIISEKKPQNSNKLWVKKQPQSVLSSSVTHIAFLDALNKTQFITGFSQTKYIFNPKLRSRIENNDFAELNGEGDFNLEKTISLNPDVFFVSGMLGTLPQFEKLSQINIPVVEVIEWVEVHPLARAEWIKFFAAFYDEFPLADSLFNEIEKNYLAISKLTFDIKNKPLVMSGKSYRGTWYMPGGKNFSSILTNDAGGFYPYHNTDSNTNSLPLSLEKVAKDFINADVWISPGASSMKELLSEDERYREFNPIKTQQIFEANKRSLPMGANDFWETGLLRPDLLLKDLVKIFHPELLPNHNLYFYQRLE